MQNGSGKRAGDPFKVFTLDELGIPSQSFITTISPTFHLASWDYYDVRRDQIGIIKEHNQTLSEQDNLRLTEYYSGSAPLQTIQDLFNSLPQEKQTLFQSLKPYRRRFVSEFEVNKEKDKSWNISKGRQQSFAQRVPSADLRSVPRVFEPLDEFIAELPQFKPLLHHIAHIRHEVH